jgi:hypothetical protein
MLYSVSWASYRDIVNFEWAKFTSGNRWGDYKEFAHKGAKR